MIDIDERISVDAPKTRIRQAFLEHLERLRGQIPSLGRDDPDQISIRLEGQHFVEEKQAGIGNSKFVGGLLRQALDLALITPGVLPTATGTQVLSFNVAGARSQSNVYLWDGASNMDTQVNSNLNNFSNF